MTDSNVLGMRKYRANIDYGLADKVNNEVAEDQRRKRLEKEKWQAEHPGQKPRVIRYEMDENAALGGLLQTQDSWIGHWERINDATNSVGHNEDSRVMMSAANLYGIANQIYEDYDSVFCPDTCDEAEKQLKSLQHDFPYCGLVLSTRIQYEPPFIVKNIKCDSPFGEIIQHYRNNNPTDAARKEALIEIPYYLGSDISDVLRKPVGLEFIQSLFSTTDNAKDIVTILEFISGKQKEKIRIFTPDLSIRSKMPQTPVLLCDRGFNDIFSIYCFDTLSHQAASRGVRIIRAGDEQ